MNMILPDGAQGTSPDVQGKRVKALKELGETALRMERLAECNGFEFLGYLMKIVRIECQRSLDSAQAEPANGTTGN